jgi:hypothetical protein
MPNSTAGSRRARTGPPRIRTTATSATPLPADDPTIFELDLRGLRRRWADTAARSPTGAELMAGADRRAQAMGIRG